MGVCRVCLWVYLRRRGYEYYHTHLAVTKKKYSCDLDVAMKKVQKITARAHFELPDFACSQQVEILFEAVHLFYRIVLEHLKHS